MAGAALAFLAILGPAAANPILYDIIPPITNAANNITITGTFTFDPAGATTLSVADIEVEGGPAPADYTFPFDSGPTSIAVEMAGGPPGAPYLLLRFQNDLADVPDPAVKITFFGLPNNMALSVAADAGEAVPANLIPEPGSLGLLVAAFGGLLLMRGADRAVRAMSTKIIRWSYTLRHAFGGSA